MCSILIICDVIFRVSCFLPEDLGEDVGKGSGQPNAPASFTIPYMHW